MARILLGSSNIYRFYDHERIPTCKPYKMINCTKMEVFKAKMDSLVPEDKKVVISVVENFICDEVKRGVEDTEKNELCDKAIKDYLKVIYETAKKLPETKFALAQPITRPGNVWYSEKYEDLYKYHTDGINAMRETKNIAKLDPLSMMSQKFEYDGVHLTPEYGEIFLRTTLEKAEDFFNAEFVDLDKMDTGDEEKREESFKVISNKLLLSTQGKPDLGERVTKLEMKVQKMDSDTETRRLNDSLVSARMREELDTITNTNKEDRLIITGMINKIPMPQGFQERKKWVLDMVGEVVETIEKGTKSKIVWANQGRRNEKEIPMAEVKMESREVARRIRLGFAEKKRAGGDFGKLFIANSVSLGTRVRIDILKAIAKKHSSEKQEFHVAAFSSRPVLMVREKGVEQRQTTLTFIDSVARYGRGMVDGDFEEAYRRAGRAFQGQLQQNFVVLGERENAPERPSRDQFFSSPRKRQREEERRSEFQRRGYGRGRGDKKRMG